MTQLTVPNKLLTGEELLAVVDSAVNSLLESGNALDGYVVLSQMEKVIEATKERLKDGAINTMTAKEMNIMGAKVSTRRSVTWEYDSPTLAKYELELDSVRNKIKGHKKALESGATVISEEGQIETANKVKDGITIAVSLPK